MRKKRSLLVGVLAVGLIAGLLVTTGALAVRPAAAAETGGICEELHGRTVHDPYQPGGTLESNVISLVNSADKILGSNFGENGYVIALFYGPPDIIVSISWEYLGDGYYDVLLEFSVPACDPELEPKFIAPALWLMALCEPNAGFSDDGWMSWDGKPSGVLYVAAAMEGPWFATEFLQPPYIMNESQLNALAAWMGVADWHGLWFKNDENGQAVHVGTAVAERDAHMDEYCGE